MLHDITRKETDTQHKLLDTGINTHITLKANKVTW